MSLKIRCKVCGKEIQSTYRHDFQSCDCDLIFIDGGDDYARIGGESFNMEVFDITSNKWIDMDAWSKND